MCRHGVCSVWSAGRPYGNKRTFIRVFIIYIRIKKISFSLTRFSDNIRPHRPRVPLCLNIFVASYGSVCSSSPHNIRYDNTQSVLGKKHKHRRTINAVRIAGACGEDVKFDGGKSRVAPNNPYPPPRPVRFYLLHQLITPRNPAKRPDNSVVYRTTPLTMPPFRVSTPLRFGHPHKKVLVFFF